MAHVLDHPHTYVYSTPGLNRPRELQLTTQDQQELELSSCSKGANQEKASGYVLTALFTTAQKSHESLPQPMSKELHSHQGNPLGQVDLSDCCQESVVATSTSKTFSRPTEVPAASLDLQNKPSAYLANGSQQPRHDAVDSHRGGGQDCGSGGLAAEAPARIRQRTLFGGMAIVGPKAKRRAVGGAVHGSTPGERLFCCAVSILT